MPDSVGKVISLRRRHEVAGHGRTEFPHLSVGTYCARCGALALREAATGGLLALDHYFRRRAGRRGICGRRDDPRPGVAARDVPRIRPAGARGFKTSKFRFWTIRRRGIWRNWRSFIL